MYVLFVYSMLKEFFPSLSSILYSHHKNQLARLLGQVVPWISSLKVQYLSLYFSSSLKAFWFPKSSN